MRYRIRHRTQYTYEAHASVSKNVLYLQPRETQNQKITQFQTTIHPAPNFRVTRKDAFGNLFEVITVESPHTQLDITTESTVKVTSPPALKPALTPSLEKMCEAVRRPLNDEALSAAEFTFASPMVPILESVHEWAAPSFPPNTPVLVGAIDLMHRLFETFTYDSNATTVTTPVIDVFRTRRGVCQDFAHIMLSALRSCGLSARYVSGYLETIPPPGKPRLIGVDASHAWVSVFVGPHGWVDLDPTNNLIPEERHVTLAYGRDYQDVTPVRGVILGGGAHHLSVSVDMAPLAVESSL